MKKYVNVPVDSETLEIFRKGLSIQEHREWTNTEMLHSLESYLNECLVTFVQNNYGRCPVCGRIFVKKTSRAKRCPDCREV